MRKTIRPALLIIIVFITGVLTAGERVIRGPETILGDAARTPLPNIYPWLYPRLATDGDEFLVVWNARSALYAQRFDREGHPLTPLPLLLERGPDFASFMTIIGVVHGGGLYSIFYNDPSGTSVIRVTHDGEVVDRRLLFAEKMSDVARVGGEILLGASRRIVRMRDDLSVIGEVAGGASRFIETPRGALALQTTTAGVIARYLDGSDPVPLPVQSLVWSGTEFVGLSANRVLRFDEQLRPIGPADSLPLCCQIRDLVVIGTDRVFATADDAATVGAVIERGVVVRQPVPLGQTATTIRTADNRLFSVDRRLNARLFDESNGNPVVTGQVQTAADELIAGGLATDREVAIARRRITGADSERNEILVSIFDPDGRLLREVSLGTAWLPTVTLGHDGRDFYALVSEIDGAARLQKVEQGAAAMPLPLRVAPFLAWNGTAFVIGQNGFTDYTGSFQHRIRLLWLDRNGKLELPPCLNWIFSGGDDARAFNPGPDMTLVVGAFVYASVQRFGEGCPTGPPADRMEHLQLASKIALQDGHWAVVRGGYNQESIDVAVTDDIESGLGPWHRIASTPEGNDDPAIAPIDGRWVILWRRYGELHAAVADERGRLAGSQVIAQNLPYFADNTPLLLPLSRERVLAVYRRPFHEPPYAGAVRVVVAPLTIEEAFRRRSVH
ncbi:MAG TPA: hypothetical protein VM733_00555 [Thermoanaerobaculia bacterium]|nr:hypothetical protein [Thermoanaerobaculia bacterium]